MLLLLCVHTARRRISAATLTQTRVGLRGSWHRCSAHAYLSLAWAHPAGMEATLGDITGTIHVHPSLGEAVQDAALRSTGHALHR